MNESTLRTSRNANEAHRLTRRQITADYHRADCVQGQYVYQAQRSKHTKGFSLAPYQHEALVPHVY